MADHLYPLSVLSPGCSFVSSNVFFFQIILNKNVPDTFLTTGTSYCLHGSSAFTVTQNHLQQYLVCVSNISVTAVHWGCYLSAQPFRVTRE